MTILSRILDFMIPERRISRAETIRARLHDHRLAELNASIVQAIRNKKRHLHLVAKRDELAAER
jgi:hypothetical protein